MNNNGFEIERKFLIRYPDAAELSRCAESSEIWQTYLSGGEAGFSERVRKRGRDGVYVYTHTKKSHITDIRRVEIEREIGEEEYLALLQRADPERSTVCKTRFCLSYENQLFEIDIYPFWTDRAIMEIELEDEAQTVKFPPMIEILREVTGDKRYTNASIARAIPEESI